jgi:TP901 family phage tail tape measure protein
MAIYKDIVLRFGGDSTRLEQSLSRTQQSVKKVTAVTAGLGSTLTKGVTVPLSALAAAATKTAVDYESAFAGVQKTVDATDRQFDRLYDSTLALSETIPVSATTLMSIEELGGQLGISTENLLGFTETVAGLGEATNLTVEAAATEFAQFANITGMSQSDFDRLGSTLVDLGNNAATTEADIMSMAMRIAGAGTSAGMSVPDVMALSTTLSSLGINAEAGGTAISTIIANIDKQVATNGRHLETWAQTAGMSAEEFAEAWKKDPVVALEAVISGMSDMQDEGGNLSVLLEELGIGSIRQTDAFKRLANSGDLFANTLERSRKAWEDNNALNAETSRRYETTESKLKLLQNRVENAAAKIGGPLAEALVDVIDDISPLIDAVANAAQAFADMDEDTQKFIITAAGFAAAAGPVLTTVSKISGGVGGVVDKLKAAGDGFALIPAGATGADGKTKMPKTKSAVTSVETAAKNAATGVEGIATAAAATDAAVSMKGAKGELDSTKTKAKGAAKAIDGGTDSITAAAKSADGIKMPNAAKEVEGVGTKAGTAAKALHGGVDALDAAASTADAAITMKTAKTNLGDVETKATKAASAIDGPKGVTGAVKAADKVSTAGAVKSIGKVEGAATSAAQAVAGGGMSLGLKGALIALGGAAVVGAIALIYGHMMDLQAQAERVRKASEGVKGALEDMGSADTSKAEDSVTALKDDTAELLKNIQDSADGAIELYEQLASDEFSTAYAAGQVTELAESIKELSARDSLTAREQWELNRAVEQFESLTGETISTVEDGNRVLTANAEAIDGITEAYRRQLKQEAYESALNDIYTKEAEAYRNLSDAKMANAHAMMAVEEAERRYWGVADGTIQNYHELEGAIQDTGDAFADSDTELQRAREALETSNEAVRTAQAEYDGLCDSVEYYEDQLYGVISADEETAEMTEEVADATEGAADATAQATEELKAYTTAGGATVETTAEMAEALGKVEDRYTSLAKGVTQMGGGIVKAIGDTGHSVTEFALMVESAGGGMDHFAAVYSSLSSVGDPFQKIEVSAASASHAIYDADGNVTNMAKSVQEMYDNIAQQQQVMDEFNAVIAELYAQAETEADIAFIDQLVEKGPQALGELQNLAGATGEQGASLHDLANAQQHLDETVAASAVQAEIERIAAAYRVMGTDALKSTYTVDEATGNIVTIVGEGADAMVLEIDGATGEIVSAISASAPEAQAAAEQVKQSAATGISGTSDEFQEEGEKSGKAFASGAESQGGQVTASSTFLGDQAYGALVSLPDEMEARGKVAGSSLGYGIWASRDQAASYAAKTVSRVVEELGGIAQTAENKGRGAGNRFRAGIAATGENAKWAGNQLANKAVTGMGEYNASAQTKGQTLGTSFKNGVGERNGAARDAGSLLARYAVSGMGTQTGAARSGGGEMGVSFYQGILSQSWNAKASGQAVAEQARTGFKTHTINAYWWGHEMGSNFASGVAAAASAAYTAAWRVAQTVASVLHFTEPDEGPLVGINDSGAEMVRNYARGMLDEAATVKAAAYQVAAAASFGGRMEPTAAQVSVGEPNYNVFNIANMVVRKESDIQEIADGLHRLQTQARGRL